VRQPGRKANKLDLKITGGHLLVRGSWIRQQEHRRARRRNASAFAATRPLPLRAARRRLV